MFSEYDVVRLQVPLPEENLAAGSTGTILLVHNQPGIPLAYEIEFLDDCGNTIAIATVLESDIEKIW